GPAGRPASPAPPPPPALPRRRPTPPADPANDRAEAAAASRTSPAVTIAPDPSATPTRPGTGAVGADAAPTHAAPAARATTPAHAITAPASRKAVAASLENLMRHSSQPGVTANDDAVPDSPGSSRVIVWVLSLVAAAGIVFLVASLMRGAPAARTPAQNPAEQPGAPNDTRSQSTEPSTVTLGALGAPPPQASATPVPPPAGPGAEIGRA